MRCLGLDLGSKRIGVALCDPDERVATPLTVVERSKSRAQDHANIAKLIAEYEVQAVVVGLPLNMSGKVTAAAQSATEETEQLRLALGIPVHLYDERLTTVTADRSLMELEMKADARRRVVDKVAAAVMLQAYLDHRRHERRMEAP
ncbi:MAG: Holliday junction resolvase RuvX [Ilumatobacteraceae bacterium]|jgi:putative Holliday junction resolvase|nr:putative pre-16S rRNA nuclease [Actinomycetes bacterium]